MAYAAVLSLINIIERIIQVDYFQILQWKEEIKYLHQKASMFQSFLEDLAGRTNEEIQILEVRSQDAVYKAEDVIDSHISNLFLFRLIPLGDHTELKKVSQDIDYIWEEVLKSRCGSKDLVPKKLLPVGSAVATRSPRNLMVGFDEDLIQIKDRLTGQQSKLQIIPIVGMGGIGKTTIAKAVYDDPLIVHHFHVRAWVTISQAFNPSEVFEAFLDKFPCCTNLDDIYKSLKGRRYLIVMDDVWDTDVWDEVRRIFPNDNNGSRIIFTTRHAYVAGYPDGSSLLHHMHFLDEEKSWNLLNEKVFAHEPCPVKLQQIGRVIAKRCGGLPLAIAVIGGLLSKADMTNEYWKYVAENLNSVVIDNDDLCSEILSLSYRGLPPHLKACFLYMVVFRGGEVVPVARLVNLWIAEGFVKPDRSKSLADVAREYIKDLVDRNLVQAHKRDVNDEPKSCKIHDLLRELCLREAEKEKLLCVLDKHSRVSSDAISEQRRFSICNPSILNNYGLGFLSFAHSFIWNGYRISSCPPFRFRLLKILDMPKVGFKFHSELLDLVNLRYIAIYYLDSVPSSISRLWNLQTLILEGCNGDLPFEIWEMSQLRYIKLRLASLPQPIDGEGSALEVLETLSGITDFKFTEGVIKRLPNLKKLKIEYWNGKAWDSCYLENLGLLEKLEKLDCSFNFSCHYLKRKWFPQSLRRITLYGGRFPWREMTIIGSLPSLQVLRLWRNAFFGPEWETNEGEFQQLKVLQLSLMDMEQWIADSCHFPTLRHLILDECERLQEIPCGMGEIPTLETIEVRYCNPSCLNSVKNIEDGQRSWGNDNFQIKIFP